MLVDLLGNDKKRKKLQGKADEFVESHSPKAIARKYIDLFERLLSE